MTLSYTLASPEVKLLKRAEIEMAKQYDFIQKLDAETREFIRRQVRISTIGATTRIENAILADAEIAWIDTKLSMDARPTAFVEHREQIEAKLSADRERSLEDVAGCREMLAVVYGQGSELYPLTQTTLRALHQELLKYHPPAAFHIGRYKVVPNSVVERNTNTGEERMVLETSPPGPLTEAAMADLLAWYNEEIKTNPWPLAVATEFVFRFLTCHPFQDGNGRLGRALFVLSMLQCEQPYLRGLAPYLCIDRAIEQRRSDYYVALARTGTRFNADATSYSLDVFLRFMLQVIDVAIEAIGFYRARFDTIRGLSEAARIILDTFKDQPESRLTPRRLRELSDVPERTVRRALATLVTEGLVQRFGRGAGTHYQLSF